MNFTKSLVAISAIVLLAGCGETKKPEDKGMNISVEEALILKIAPTCNKEKEGLMQFDTVRLALRWVEKYAAEVEVRSVETKQGHATGLYGARAPDTASVRYHCLF